MKKIFAIILSFCLVSALPAMAEENLIDKSGFTAKASTVWRDSNAAQLAIDGKMDTNWHSHPDDKNKFPVYFDVDFGKNEAVSGICYYARFDNEGNINGVWSKFDVEISSDGINYQKAVTDLSTKAVKDVQKINFGKTVEARYMRFTILEGSKGYATCKEIDFIKGDKKADVTAMPSKEGELIDKTGITANASTFWNSNQTAASAVDGKMETTWHSHPDDRNKFPVNFDVDFGKEVSVKAIRYYARVDAEGNINGVWSGFDVEVSSDGINYQTKVKGLSTESKAEAQVISFGKTVTGRYFRFKINEGSKGYATCKELEFVAGNPSDEAKDSAGVATVSKTGWKIISSSTFRDSKTENIIDNNPASFWHSNYYTADNKTIDGKDEAPFYISIILPSETAISGFTYLPRQDKVDTGKVKAYEIYASDNEKGAAYKIYEGTFSVGKEELTVDFGFDVKVHSFVFVVKDSVSGYGTIAELGLIQAKGASAKAISDVKMGTSEIAVGEGTEYAGPKEEKEGAYYTDKTKWKIEASSARLPHYPATKAIDGNKATYWHTDFTDDGGPVVTSMVKGPHTLDITFPEARILSGFSYQPRDGHKAGIVTGYELYLADADDSEWIKVDEGTFKDDASLKYVYLSQNVKAKKLRFKSVSSVSDYGVCAEFDVMTENKELTTAENVSAFASYNKENKLVKIPETSVTSVDASSVWNENNGTNFVFDGATGRAWHSAPADKGKFPITLYVELDNVYTIPALDYYARVDGEGSINGAWTKFNIWTSEDGVDYNLAYENLSLKSIKEVQRITFETHLKAKFIEFEVLEGTKGYATCGEMVLYERMADVEARKNGNYYNLVIGSNKIVSAKNGVEKETVIDVAPFIDDGRTMIPLRGLLEEMGATITWDGSKRKIGITTDKVKIELQIMNDLCYVTDSKYGRVRYTLDVPPVIKDGRTFIPVRFVTEQLGYNVSWDGETKTVKITE